MELEGFREHDSKVLKTFTAAADLLFCLIPRLSVFASNQNPIRRRNKKKLVFD